MNKFSATKGTTALTAFASTYRGAEADLAEVFDEWANEALGNAAYEDAMEKVEELGVVAALTDLGWDVKLEA